MDPDEALAKGYWNLAMIALVGLFAVIFIVAVFLLRRWKHRELRAIDERRAARRERLSGGRVDAWAASSERYIDHDKLPDDDEAFDHDSTSEGDDDDDEPIPGSTAENETDAAENPDDEDRDPYGLFSDKPYQDPDDDDDFDEDEDDGDWDDDDDKH